MPRLNKILIVGAGIGGLCTGVALARIGVEVDIIDIKPDNSVPGVGWGLRTNGLRVLREVGDRERALGDGNLVGGLQTLLPDLQLLLGLLAHALPLFRHQHLDLQRVLHRRCDQRLVVV